MTSGKVKKGEHSERDILQAIKDLKEKFSKRRLDEIQNSVVTNLTAVISGKLEWYAVNLKKLLLTTASK